MQKGVLAESQTAPTWRQSALGSAFCFFLHTLGHLVDLARRNWDSTRIRNNEKVMSKPAHVTHLQGKDKMYSTEFPAPGCLVSIFFLYIWNEKKRSIDSLTVSSWSPTYLWNETSLSLWYLFLHPYAEQDCTIVLKSQPKYQRCQTNSTQSSL